MSSILLVLGEQRGEESYSRLLAASVITCCLPDAGCGCEIDKEDDRDWKMKIL